MYLQQEIIWKLLLSILIGAHSFPDRIAAQVEVGIGFVWAGVIFKDSTRVYGIKTAAIIWITAALGMGIGAGYQLVSVIACFLLLMVLLLFSKWEVLIDRASPTRDY